MLKLFNCSTYYFIKLALAVTVFIVLCLVSSTVHWPHKTVYFYFCFSLLSGYNGTIFAYGQVKRQVIIRQIDRKSNLCCYCFSRRVVAKLILLEAISMIWEEVLFQGL